MLRADLAWAVIIVAGLAATYRVVEHQPHLIRQIQPFALRSALGSASRSEGAAGAPSPARPESTPPPQAPTPQPTPHVASPEPTPSPLPVHVAFTATEPVWISVKCDGNVTFAGRLEVTQSRTFDATNAVTALIGNLGGVQVSVNGRPIGPLGAHGEVQAVELTTNGVRRITRRHDSSTDDSPSIPQL